MSRVTVSRENVTMDLTSYYFSKRSIWLFNGISDETAEDVCQKLLYLNSINESPINLNIQSGGGSVYAALSIIGTIEAIKSPVHITVCGLAASAAALITVYGAKGERTMLKHATMMFHQVISSNPHQKSFPDIEIAYNETKRLNEKMFDMVHERIPTLEPRLLRQLIERDWFLTAEKALEMGIIDKIRYIEAPAMSDVSTSTISTNTN